MQNSEFVILCNIIKKSVTQTIIVHVIGEETLEKNNQSVKELSELKRTYKTS